MLEHLPPALADALQGCVTKAFNSDRFDRLLATRPGLAKLRKELIDEVYENMVFQQEGDERRKLGLMPLPVD